MSQDALTLQTAIANILTADPAIKALIGEPARLYSGITPEDTLLPYISFSNCSNTSYSIMLNVWTHNENYKECEEILKTLRTVLDNAIINIPEFRRITSYSNGIICNNDTINGIIRFTTL